jgi:nucleoid DNA-binding protein
LGFTSEQTTKWYARANRLKTLNTTALARHISSHGSPFTQDIVEGVLRKLANCIPELVSEGHGVKLDGIGIFYPMVRCTGADSKEQTIKHYTPVADYIKQHSVDPEPEP